MSQHRHIGLERQDGYDVGRDPRTMSACDLERLGHARVSPLRAVRLKCLDCCNGSAREVRLCTAVDCPSWPFRMGKNPWRAPLGAEAHAQRAATMNRNRASGFTAPDNTQAEIDALPPEWERGAGRRSRRFFPDRNGRRRGRGE